MHDVFAMATDAKQGLQVMSIDEWIRDRFFAAESAKARENIRRMLDERGVPAKHAMRTQVTEDLERGIEECYERARDAIEKIAEGRSLDELGRILGVQLMRAPRFDLGEPSLQTFAEIIAVRTVQALARWSDEKGLSLTERKRALEAAQAPIMQFVRNEVESEQKRREQRSSAN